MNTLEGPQPSTTPPGFGVADFIMWGVGAWVIGNFVFAVGSRTRRGIKRFKQKRQGWPKRIDK